jgi:hypothetical protein
LNVAVRTGIERLRLGFETLARAAQERGDLDSALEPKHFSRVVVSLLQGLLLQYGVYEGEIDIDAYVRAATTLIDGHPAIERAGTMP